MGFDPNGMDRLNQFALVIYIPDPLGQFLDELRLELAPDCIPHAHVSVLPPRPLFTPWQVVCEEARAVAGEFPPFEIEAGEPAVFPSTEVIYLELARGGEELRRIHDALCRGRLSFCERYPYHPHITLAQDVPAGKVQEIFELASRRWREYAGPRTFRAEKAAFVQNIGQDRWIDLAEFSLGAVPVL
jgi:hypothetical protein